MMLLQTVRSEGGFTLIEALVAMVVLTIGILSLFTMTTTNVKGNAKAQGITLATAVLERQVEELLSVSYDDSTLSTSGEHTETTGLPSSVSSLTWTVTEWESDSLDNDGDSKVDEYDERGIKEITLTVAFQAMGVQKTHQVQFCKAKVFK